MEEKTFEPDKKLIDFVKRYWTLDFLLGCSTSVIYFSSEDCITEEERVEDAGGKLIRKKTEIGEFGFISLFQDLDGNTIDLHSKK